MTLRHTLRGFSVKGALPKRIAACHLACQTCSQFRDDDPDIFYCAEDRIEFPGLCENYTPRNVPRSEQTHA